MKTVLRYSGQAALWLLSLVFFALSAQNLYLGDYVATVVFAGIATAFIPFVAKQIFTFIFGERKSDTSVIKSLYHVTQKPAKAPPPPQNPQRRRRTTKTKKKVKKK
jgi:hypothetical protein